MITIPVSLVQAVYSKILFIYLYLRGGKKPKGVGSADEHPHEYPESWEETVIFK